MIKEVTFEKTTYNDLPYKYEAGTPNIADTLHLKRHWILSTKPGKKKSAGMKKNCLHMQRNNWNKFPV